MAPLGDPSVLTQGTEFKSHSTLHRVSFADTASMTTAALPHPRRHAQQLATPTAEAAMPTSPARGLLTMRKLELDRKKSGSKVRYHGVTKSSQIKKETVTL